MTTLTPGQMLGPYRILGQIGQGGMATVYKAYQAAMDRNVAIKLLPSQLAESPEFTGRFRQEARVIARLEHAHILPVYDYGESDGYSYLVMRYLEAGTLREYLRGKALGLGEVDRIFTQLADALEYAHAQGIVHRDLKPSNVLLDERGNVYLTDFGIAKLLASDSKFTGTGAMIGTPAYMSPEQAHGVAVDQRSDIYSLGIILYEMVTGRVPFDADTPLAIILKQLNDPLPLPTSIRPDLPPAIESVLLKALAKEPAQRFATTAEFVAAWKSALPRAPATVSRPLSDLPPARPASVPPGSRPISGAPAPGIPSGAYNPPTSVAPPASGAASGAAPAAASAAPRRNKTALFGGVAALVLLLCVGAVCAVFAYNTIVNRPAATVVVPTPASTTAALTATAAATASRAPNATVAATANGAPTAAGGTPVAAKTGWTSWTAPNIIYTIGVAGDTLLTGGAGGVTRWSADGKVIDRLTTGNGLPGTYVLALLTEPDNRTLWVATDNGLLRTDGATNQVYNSKNGLDGNAVTDLAETSQGLLAATADSNVAGGGLLLFAAGHWQAVSHFPSVADNPQEGQLSTRVQTLLVDHAGDWWVGTTAGLGHFDGKTWQVFTSTAGLTDNNITSLSEVDGHVWVGTSSGVVMFDGAQFTAVSDVSISPVYSILATKDGSVWVTGGGGAARRSAGHTDWKTFDSQQLPSYTLYGAREAPDGTLLIGSDDGLVHIHGNDVSVQRVPNSLRFAAYSAIVQQFKGDNLYFVQQYGDGIDMFDEAQQQWQPGPVLPCGGCVPLALDGKGRGWGGGSQGLWITSGQTVQHLTTVDGLPSDDVRVVAFITTTAWIGTGGGVAVYDGQRITQVYSAGQDGLPSDEISSLLADKDGGMWVGTSTGLSHFSPAGKWEHFTQGNPFTSSPRITDLAQDHEGAIWATTNGDGLYRYQGGDWQRLTPSSTGGIAPIDELHSVTVAPDGSLWFGGTFRDAIHFKDNQWETFGVSDGLIHSDVNDIFVRPDGTVWFATSGGISRYKP